MKQTLLIAGCGDVALRAAPLLQTHYRLLGMYRRPENREPLRLQGITPVFGDLDIPDSLSKISGLAHGCCIWRRHPTWAGTTPAPQTSWQR